MAGNLPDQAAAFPRKIWFVWFDGLEHAPEVVRRCHDSWLARNPDWDVVTFDEASLPTVTSLDYSKRQARHPAAEPPG